ncbi:MAG: hypothetical protein ISS26_01600 [Candidatus Omnitrophica bacterium]|nr:hypothetical protein [Candidatus Omnitrophota bacterium]
MNEINKQHLNRYFHFDRLMKDCSIECVLERYKSDHDGIDQSVLIMRPAGRRSKRIFFFFHGMSGDRGDGIVAQDLVKKLDATIVSMGGRGPCWISDGFIQDAEKVIEQYSKGYKGYYLMGISMGGTQAFSLAGLLSNELQRAISGVIALMPGSDLPAIADRSSHKSVRDTLISSVGGDITRLEQRSPDRLIGKYRKGLPFSIFYNEHDTVLLSEKLEGFIQDLQKRHPVSVFTAPGEHDFTYEDFDYKKIFDALGRDPAAKEVLNFS